MHTYCDRVSQITLSTVIDILWCFHTRARQGQNNDKTNVEPVQSYEAFHTRFVGPGVTISLAVTPLAWHTDKIACVIRYRTVINKSANTLQDTFHILVHIIQLLSTQQDSNA